MNEITAGGIITLLFIFGIIGFIIWGAFISPNIHAKGEKEKEIKKYGRPISEILSRTKTSQRLSNYPDNWSEIRLKVLRRDGNRCGNCGATINLHVHHIVPLSKGGTNRLSNLRVLCSNCHKRLHPHMK